MTPAVGELARSALALFLFFPALTVITSWLRGLLIHSRHTRYVNVGMMFNLAITTVILLVGVAARWPGLPAAAVALNVAALGETAYLLWRTQHTLPIDLRLFGPPRAQPSSL